MQDQKKNKVNLESSELTQERIDELRKIFPEVFNEDKIDWDKLKQVLGEQIDKGTEKFGFMWVGKTSAINSVLSTSKLTLKPEKDQSIKFDESKNLIIEGDNLETLKLLQKAYFQKVKMIYIDPPYNTGGDFVYKDDYKAPLDSYLQQTGQKDENGGSLTTNKETNGRFHSSWLTMMYPRLKLAWNLLRDDGVIFVSIDDNEVHRLRMVMDEIFGEINFLGNLIWKNKYGGGAKTNYYVTTHEYILCFSKNIQNIKNIEMPYNDKLRKYYKYKDKKFNLRGPYRLQPLATNSNDYRPNLCYPINYNGKEIKPEKQWQWSKDRTDEAIRNDEIVFTENNDSYSVNFKQYLKDENGNERKTKPFSVIEEIYTQHGTNEIKKMFGDGKIFSFPKPSSLIKYLARIFTFNSDVILDFFAGSGTTAQAVLELNKEDKGSRKFILVQLPEPTPKESEANKEGFKTIADICTERVRRVIKGYGDKPEPLQEGFKVFKLDKSSYVENNFEHDPNKTNEENIKAFEAYLSQAKQSSLFESVKPIDVVYENIVKEGLSLNASITKTKIDGNEVYKVEDADNNLSFFITLDKEISKDTIRTLLTKEYKNKLFIGLDSAFSDSDKANLGLHLTLKTI